MTARPALALVDTVDAEFGEATALVEFRGEVADRPTLDPEAQVLCALLWATPETAQTVVEHLEAGDFERPAYGDLYTVIARLVRKGHPHSSPLVLAQLERTGRLHGHLSRTLLDVTLADARGHEARHLAHAVIAQAYRRGYTRAAVRLAQIGEQAHTEDMYELMCELGRERRDAKDRLAAATEALL